MHVSTGQTLTLGEAVGATSLSGEELLAWVNAGVLPALVPGLDGIPVWPVEVVALITQVDGFLELDLQLDDVRELLQFAGFSRPTTPTPSERSLVSSPV